MARTQYKGQWCWLYTTDSEFAIKVKIEKVVEECGHDAYDVSYENGTKETIFANTVNRIIPVHGKKAKIIDFKKRREKIKLVK